MSATAVSRVGKVLIKTEPRGFNLLVRLEDSSTPGIIPAFTLLGVKADGFAEIPVSTVAYNWIGYTTEEVDTSDDASDGDSLVTIRVGCVAKLVGASLTQADVGSPVYLADNQTVTTDVGEGKPVTVKIAGGSAGDHTVTGIAANDDLVSVFQESINETIKIIGGGAAGNHTVTGIVLADDELVSVIHETIAGFLVDLTSEFTIDSDDTIDNTAGTATTSDSLIVTYRKRSGLRLVDLTSEFSIDSVNTINNDAGTATTDDSLIVTYRNKSAAFVGYITEFLSATEVYVFLPGRLPPGIISV